MFLEASRIVRLCPLSPRIMGTARRDVTPEKSIYSYDTFYINKYHCLSDFMYTNKL